MGMIILLSVDKYMLVYYDDCIQFNTFVLLQYEILVYKITFTFGHKLMVWFCQSFVANSLQKPQISCF